MHKDRRVKLSTSNKQSKNNTDIIFSRHFGLIVENTDVVYTETPIGGVFKCIHSGERFPKVPFLVTKNAVLLWTEGQTGGKKSCVFEFIGITVNETLAAVTEPERVQFYKI